MYSMIIERNSLKAKHLRGQWSGSTSTRSPRTWVVSGSRERVYVTISVDVPGTCSTESSAPQSTRGEGSVRSASAHHRAKAGAHSGRRPRVRSLCRARRYRTHHAGATKFGGVGEHLAGPKNT